MENLFFIGQRIIHAREGLATIVSETSISGLEFFIVRPDSDASASISVNKKRTEGIIRPVMNKEQADAIVKYIKQIQAEFTTNTKQRRDLYKKKLSSGDPYDLAFLSTQLYLYHYLNDNGTLVKLGPTDVEMLKTAERMLFDELAISYELPRDKVQDYVIDLIKKA